MFAIEIAEAREPESLGMRVMQPIQMSFAALLLCLVATAVAEQPDNARSHFGVGESLKSPDAKSFSARLGLYNSAGIGVLRIEIGWRDLELQQGQWQDLPSVPRLKEAIREGFKLKVNIGSMSNPPGWYFQQHPDAQMVNQDGLKSFNVVSYWYPDLYKLLEEKDDKAFAYLARNGLLGGLTYVIVPLGPAGEPLYPVPWTTSRPGAAMRFWFYDSHAQLDFPVQMRVKYQKIDSANEAWGTQFRNWSEVKIPERGTFPGAMWGDVLTWYRDAKRNFVIWQMTHYQRLLSRYYPRGHAPRLVILVPGQHLTAFEMAEAIRSGGVVVSDNVKMMSDSDFLLDVAQKFGAVVQYTGTPNIDELEHLAGYIRDRHYALQFWGENAGNKGDPRELDEEVLANGLFGQEYIGSNLFNSDLVTPTAQYAALRAAHTWLKAAWAGTNAAGVSFSTLPLSQNSCIFGDAKKTVSLCMQSDGNLVLRLSRIKSALWASNTSNRASNYCAHDEDPASTCTAMFQGDGNFVVLHGSQPVWNSGTARRGAEVTLSDKPPYLVISDAMNRTIWIAKSAGQ